MAEPVVKCPTGFGRWRAEVVLLLRAENAHGALVRTLHGVTEDATLGLEVDVPGTWRAVRSALDDLSGPATVVEVLAKADAPPTAVKPARDTAQNVMEMRRAAAAWVACMLKDPRDLVGAQAAVREHLSATALLGITLNELLKAIYDIEQATPSEEAAPQQQTMLDRAAVWVQARSGVFTAVEVLREYHGGRIPDEIVANGDEEKRGTRVITDLRDRRDFIIDSMRDLRRRGEPAPAAKGYRFAGVKPAQ